MKIKDIVPGGYYYDGKVGVREVISLEGTPLRVTYRIIAAKVVQEYSYADKQIISTIGTTSSCDLASFAQWAKIKVEEDERETLLADLAVKKISLPPGEKAFMYSVAGEITGGELRPKVGLSISFSFNETRQVRGIERKGLATVSRMSNGNGGDITLTALGAAWIRAQHAEPK